MTFKDKKLYHQIHPLKLLVDISTGFFTTYLAWEHNIFWFLITFFVPSVVISLLLVQFANLEPLKNSHLGKYIERYMTSTIEFIRISGQILMWVAAWYHLPLLIVIGFLIIVAGWCNGLLFKKFNIN